MARKARKFGKTTYVLAKTCRTKKNAEKEKKAIKKFGHLARIVKVKKGYQVWEASSTKTRGRDW